MTEETQPRADWRLNRELVEGFVAGPLLDTEEAALADEVARLLPHHARLPLPLAAQLDRIRDHLGGDAGLWAWLDRHPGRPRVTSRIYSFMAMLDRIGAEEAVVTAVAEVRARHADPPPLERYLVPDTTIETLPSLAGELELLLADDRPDEALRAALAATELLLEAAPRVAELNPQLRGLGAELTMARRMLTESRDA
jgi:hypothetical protein